MAAMLRKSAAVVVVVVRTRRRAIPLAMKTMKKSTHGFPFLSFMSGSALYVTNGDFSLSDPTIKSSNIHKKVNVKPHKNTETRRVLCF